MEVKVYPDYESLSAAVSQLIQDYVARKKDALICLASGHTPVGVFRHLAKSVQAGKTDLSQCTFLSLDEWVGIDPKDPGSCMAMLKKDFFEPLAIDPARIEFFNVTTSDLQGECDRINGLISKNKGLDIMLVGVGTNGHIGMSEPGTSFNTYAHISTLAEETKTVGQKYFEKNTELSNGITLGLRHLREAALPIVMANGEKKAAILAKGLSVKPSSEIPVSIVQLIPQGFVMLDQEAAQKLN